MIYTGIDIGSTCTKVVVTDEQQDIIYKDLMPTGWDSVGTATSIQETLRAEFPDKQMKCVATGYGRVAVPYADKTITEITCHGRGAVYLIGTDPSVVIDIGGQDTKIISLVGGKVKDFLMNDKCSAGTGRFLESMANTLGVSLEGLCDLAAEGSGITISSMCTVFAESEVISLIGKGTDKEDIAFGVVESIVNKVQAQAARLIVPGEQVYLTGGLCDLPYIISTLSEKVGSDVISSPLTRYAGAIGASILAQNL